MKYIFILLLFTSCITINKYYTYPTVTKEIPLDRQFYHNEPNFTLPYYKGWTVPGNYDSPIKIYPYYRSIDLDTTYNYWLDKNGTRKGYDTLINVHPIYIK